jgi:HK97 family phage prohead protease
MNKELRFSAQELRAATGSDKAKKLTGYACTWNTQADIGPFLEVIAPKPFKSLDTDEVVMLMNHDDSLILGRSGVNLELTQDDKGLRFTCTLNDSSIASDVWENTKSGILRECSFAFTVNPNGETWTTLPDGKMLRTLQDLQLWDASIVTVPAYSGTSAAARNIIADDIQQRMSRALRATNEVEGEDDLGVVPFSKHDARSEDSYDSVDEANGLISWAEGDEDERSADSPVKNRMKAAQGFLYVKNDGSKVSDYRGPHHTIVDGKLAHSQIGALRCAKDFVSGNMDIPAEHRAAVKNHLDSELGLWFGDGDGGLSDDERQAAVDEQLRTRLMFLKYT